MREILFRAKAQGKGGKWVEGALINVDGYTCILERTNPGEYDYPYLDGDIGVIDGCACPIVPETVGQYTGLKDKNGKRIFEGDIIQYDKAHAIVRAGTYPSSYEREHTHVGFFIEWTTDVFLRIDLAFWTNERSVEVVGTIHDNAELMEGRA